jgi:hypothetical protein
MKAKPQEEKGGSTENVRGLQSNTKSLPDQASPVNAYGTHELCAWRVGQGQFWFQTTRSDLARKLAKRSDTRRVEIVGLNHYRQTFEIRGTRRKGVAPVLKLGHRTLLFQPEKVLKALEKFEIKQTKREM